MNTNSTLQHHGVLGMKWGIRRYQPYPKGHKGGKEVGKAAKVEQRNTRLVNKATKKIKRIDRKITKIDTAAKKQYQKALKSTASLFNREKKTKKLVTKSVELSRSADLLAARGSRYYEKMSKKFDKLGIEMNKELQTLGESYISRMENNTRELYNAQIYFHNIERR